MLEVLGSTACSSVSVSADSWIPLTISWHMALRDGPAYLYVTGCEGGYVEFKVNPDTGAVCGFVVIDLPPKVERFVNQYPERSDSGVPILDLGLWEWKVTPDYRELVRRDVDIEIPLSFSASPDGLIIWFSELPVSRYVDCGDIRVGVSSGSGLVSISADLSIAG